MILSRGPVNGLLFLLLPVAAYPFTYLQTAERHVDPSSSWLFTDIAFYFTLIILELSENTTKFKPRGIV